MADGRPGLARWHVRRLALQVSHRRNGPLCRGIQLKIRHRRKTKGVRHHIAGELTHAVILLPGRAVVIPPGHLDFVFQRAKGSLHLPEIFAGLEVGIGLGNGKQPAQRAGKRVLRMAQLNDLINQMDAPLTPDGGGELSLGIGPSVLDEDMPPLLFRRRPPQSNYPPDTVPSPDDGRGLGT